jgi:nickel/cobalt transporter (NiCoT) family protein
VPAGRPARRQGLGAYEWAFVKPVRKLYYNITITTISVVVALLVGSVEGFGLLADRLHLSGGFWDVIGSLNDNFGVVGYVIIAVFVVSWLRLQVEAIRRAGDSFGVALIA